MEGFVEEVAGSLCCKGTGKINRCEWRWVWGCLEHGSGSDLFFLDSILPKSYFLARLGVEVLAMGVHNISQQYLGGRDR